MKNAKPTLVSYCSECQRDFAVNEIVHYTWYENRCFCDKCKTLMNARVNPSYLDWEYRRFNKEEAISE